MNIVENYTLRQINKKVFLLENQNRKTPNEKMITFNSTAAFLWMALRGKDFTTQDVEKLLIDKYCIDQNCAKIDAKHIINVWIQSSLIK